MKKFSWSSRSSSFIVKEVRPYYRQISWIFFGILVFGFIQLQAQEFELVQPESYAIRRFAEVVSNKMKELEEKDRAEVLIELRAQLAIAERQVQQLASPDRPSDAVLPLSGDNTRRAAQALRDHFQKKLERLEKTTRRKK